MRDDYAYAGHLAAPEAPTYADLVELLNRLDATNSRNKELADELEKTRSKTGLAQLEQENGQLRRQLESAVSQSSLADLESRLTRQTQTITQLEKDRQVALDRLNDIENGEGPGIGVLPAADENKLHRRIRDLTRRNNELERENKTLTVRVQQLENAPQEAASPIDIEDAQFVKAYLENEYKEFADRLEDVKVTISSNQTDIEAAMELVNALKGKLRESENELTSAKSASQSDDEKLQENIAAIREELETTEGTVTLLEETLENDIALEAFYGTRKHEALTAIEAAERIFFAAGENK